MNKKINKIRLIRFTASSDEERECEDYEINGNLDLRDQKKAHNISILDEDIKSGYICKIPMHIWKISIGDGDFEFYKNQKIEDKELIHCFGTSINIFTVDGEDLYMRDISLNHVKVGKGYIEYCKEKDCAIVVIKL